MKMIKNAYLTMIEGIALISDTTASLRPSFLEIILNGLRTLSILITLMNWILRSLNIMEIIYKQSIKSKLNSYRECNNEKVHDVPTVSQITVVSINHDTMYYHLE